MMAYPAFTFFRSRSLVWIAGCGALLMACGCAASTQSASGFALKRPGSLFAPKGSPWTILCSQFRGPHRAELVQQFAETLKRTPGIQPDDVVVLDDAEGVTRLYYGVYYRRTDPKTGKRSIPERLRKDLELIKQLGSPSGKYFFLMARTVRVPTPNVGNPDWALSRVDATYSLQVAVFEPTDEFWDFKLAAAEYCKFLRDKGYEAYYHHGRGCSVVTVGTFGEDGVRKGSDGRPYYSPDVVALQQDELLKYNRLNGAIYRVKTDEGTSVRVRSRLVKIPSSQDADPWEAHRPS
jgi:hypothetical protein